MRRLFAGGWVIEARICAMNISGRIIVRHGRIYLFIKISGMGPLATELHNGAPLSHCCRPENTLIGRRHPIRFEFVAHLLGSRYGAKVLPSVIKTVPVYVVNLQPVIGWKNDIVHHPAHTMPIVC
jgi:hypothetical protein